MKIEIDSTTVDEFAGTSKNGKPFRIRKQTAYAHISGKYPDKIEINLRDDQQAYPAGQYQLASESFFVGRYGDLQVRPVLAKA